MNLIYNLFPSQQEAFPEILPSQVIESRRLYAVAVNEVLSNIWHYPNGSFFVSQNLINLQVEQYM